MIIDFHTHFFPDSIAKKAVTRLSAAEGVQTYTEGTESSLLESSKRAGVTLNVYLPVVTKPSQTDGVNRNVIALNEKYADRLNRGYMGPAGIYSFGALHPENEDFRQQIDMLKSNGVKGIKLHPLFQNTYFDDIRYMRIVDYACEMDMIINVHAGSDLANPTATYSSSAHILKLMKELRPDRLIVAHMGGWNRWEEKENILQMIELGAYMDTSFSLWNPADPQIFFTPLSVSDFHEYLDLIRPDHVLFGTDSPWTDQTEALSVLKAACREMEEYQRITEINPAKLLGL